MKILVTGGSGFLGSHMADALSDRGHKVTIPDQKKSKYLRKDQKFVKIDILNEKNLEKTIKKNEVVFHFAALADLDESMLDPIGTVKQNILGTTLILKACVKYNIKKIIYASSIYSVATEGGFYACSKTAAERYIVEFKRVHNLNYSIIRYGSLYGPRSNENNGIYKILSDSIKKKKYVYFGNKLARRRYINVFDAAKTTVETISKKYNNKIVNILGGKEYKIQYLFQTLQKLLKIDKKVSYLNKKFTGHFVKKPKILKTNIGKTMKINKETSLIIGLKNLIQTEFNKR